MLIDKHDKVTLSQASSFSGFIWESPVCPDNLVGRCKRTALSKGHPAPSTSPSVAFLTLEVSSSPSKTVVAMASVLASLNEAFYKTEVERGRRRASGRSTLHPLSLWIHFLQLHYASLFVVLTWSQSNWWKNTSHSSPLLWAKRCLLCLQLETEQDQSGRIKTVEHSLPHPPTTALLTGNSRAGCLPWVTSNWRICDCRDANALHWAGMLSPRSGFFELGLSSISQAMAAAMDRREKLHLFRKQLISN